MRKRKPLQKTISKLVEISFKDGKLVESQVTKSIKLLKSLPKIDAIWALLEYLKQLKLKQRAHTMYIETTVPLSPAQIKKAKKIIERKVTITKVVTSINPEILGGFKLRVGDEVWDETFLGKINKVKEAIISGGSNQSN